MDFLKKLLGKHWLKLLVLLPIAPIIILLRSLDRFSGIDHLLRFLVSVAIVLFYLLLIFMGTYFSIRKLKIGKAVVGLLTIGLFFATTYGAALANRVDTILENITAPPMARGYSLVAMADFDAEALDGYGRVGVLTVVEESMEEAREIFLEEQDDVPNPVTTNFDMPTEMISALYAGEIDAMIITSNFVHQFGELDAFEDIEYDTIVLATFDVTIEQEERIDIDPGEPFSILLLGLNQNDQPLSNGTINTFMLLTINLQELSVTAVSIPRDSFVPLPCFNYQLDKLSHVNAGGSACAVDAIEHLLDMEIPYYVKLNFTGFMEIIDILGGIEVDVPFTFVEQDSQRRRGQYGEYLIYLQEGLQRLNGEEALALTRHRQTLYNQDFGRVESQQLVFQAMLREMFTEVSGINDILPLLEVIGPHVETNLSAHDITTLALYMLGLLQDQPSGDIMNEVHFMNMVILGEGQDVTHPFPMNVVLLWENMIADARSLMMINLGLEEPEFAVTFGFDAFAREGRRWLQPSYGALLTPNVPVDPATYVPTEPVPWQTAPPADSTPWSPPTEPLAPPPTDPPAPPPTDPPAPPPTAPPAPPPTAPPAPPPTEPDIPVNQVPDEPADGDDE